MYCSPPQTTYIHNIGYTLDAFFRRLGPLVGQKDSAERRRLMMCVTTVISGVLPHYARAFPEDQRVANRVQELFEYAEGRLTLDELKAGYPLVASALSEAWKQFMNQPLGSKDTTYHTAWLASQAVHEAAYVAFQTRYVDTADWARSACSWADGLAPKVLITVKSFYPNNP